MANTTNYNWETPDDTDLVKDGAAAIRTLGSSIDTTTKNLNPETTLGDIAYRSSTSNTNTRLGIGTAGQVLTVASGVPSWATPTTGDIEGVTAGTGITGGGTSGTVTITNDMATTITAAGDIVVGTGSGTYDNLPIGTTGQVLTADTTVSPYKVKWAAAAGGGKVLQVVSTTYSTEVTVASTTFTDTGLTLNITPTSASSTILVLANVGCYATRNNDGQDVKLRLVRNSTAINTQDGASNIYAAGDSAVAIGFFGTLIHQDSPATTSATTYKMQGAVSSTSNSGQVVFQQNNRTSTITLMEIGA